MASSALPYACVARVEAHGTCAVLAEVALAGGNAAEITRKILRKLPPASAGAQRSFTYEGGYSFHILGDRSTVLLCMERDIGAADAFRFLSQVQHQWAVEFGTATHASSSGGRSFEKKLAQLMEDAVHSALGGGAGSGAGSQNGGVGDAGDEELQVMQDRLDNIKTVMSDSIERVLERGERIDSLVDKTEALHQSAFKFAKSSNSLQRQLRWQNKRWLVAAGCAALGALLLLGATFCGGADFAGCRGSRETAATAWSRVREQL